MKNKLIIGTVLTGMLFTVTPVEAMGNAKVIFSSNDNIEVGNTFTVTMSVADINDTYDGVVSMGGNLSFDSDMLEYVSSNGTETPYLFQINEDYGYKIAGLDFTLDNGIRESLIVYEFTFRALKEGTTTITLENAKLTDSQSYIDTVVLEKEINIQSNEEVVEEILTTNKLEEIVINPSSIVEIETNGNINNNIKTDLVKDSAVKVTKKEIKKEIKEEKIVEKDITLDEQEDFIEKVQKIINNLITQLKELFK